MLFPYGCGVNRGRVTYFISIAHALMQRKFGFGGGFDAFFALMALPCFFVEIKHHGVGHRLDQRHGAGNADAAGEQISDAEGNAEM